jgi:hypothetical protein
VGSGHPCDHCGGWDGGGDSHECPGPVNDRLDMLEDQQNELASRVYHLEELLGGKQFGADLVKFLTEQIEKAKSADKT